MVRVEGIEPSPQAWEAHVLPLNYTRIDDEVRLKHPRHNAIRKKGSRGVRPVFGSESGASILLA